jgi:hypothetical protein
MGNRVNPAQEASHRWGRLHSSKPPGVRAGQIAAKQTGFLDVGHNRTVSPPFGGQALPFAGGTCASVGFDQQLCQCLWGSGGVWLAHVKSWFDN